MRFSSLSRRFLGIEMPYWTDEFVAMGSLYYPQAPKDSLELVGHTLVGFAIGDRAYVRRGRKRVYPNTWGLLVGESGTMKSSSVEYGAEFLAPWEDYRIGNPESRQGLHRQLKNHADETHNILHWLQPEFGTVFATMADHPGMREDLCLLYDHQLIESHRAKKADSFVIPPLHVSLVGGITPDICGEYVRALDLEQGVIPRVLVCYPDPKPFARMPKDPTIYDSKFADLLDDYTNFVMTMNAVKPAIEFKLTDDGAEFYNLWCEDLAGSGRVGGSTAKRIETYILKWAIVESFSNNIRNLNTFAVHQELDDDEIEFATKKIEPYISYARRVEGLIHDKSDYRKVCDLVDELGTVARRTAMNNKHIEAKRMDEIEATGKKRGRFTVEVVEGRTCLVKLHEKEPVFANP